MLVLVLQCQTNNSILLYHCYLLLFPPLSTESILYTQNTMSGMQRNSRHMNQNCSSNNNTVFSSVAIAFPLIRISEIIVVVGKAPLGSQLMIVGRRV